MKKGEDCYKESEAGVIPSDWQASKVGSLCKLINGRGFKPYEWRSNGLPIIRIQNLNGSDEFNYFDGAYNPKLEVENGQLLYAWSGSRGTSFGPHIWNGPLGLLNYHTWKVVPNTKRVTPKFLFYALKGLTDFIEESAHGASALVHVQKWQMEGFSLAHPADLEEQEAIAIALSETDSMIGSLEALINKKRLIKQAVMQDLLTGQIRLSGFSEEWRLLPIGSIAPLKRGFDLPNSALKDGSYPVVYSNGIMNHHEKPMVKGPGVVTGRSGTIGKIQYVSQDFWPHNTSLWVTSFNGNCPKFIYYFYSHIGFERFSSGSGVPTLNRNDAHSHQVNFPIDVREQEAIAELFSIIDAEIALLDEKIEKSKKIKRGMIQDLLTGRVRLL